MAWLYILLGLFLLVAIALFCPLWIYLSYDSEKETDPLELWAIYLFHFKIYPRKPADQEATTQGEPNQKDQKPIGSLQEKQQSQTAKQQPSTLSEMASKGHSKEKQSPTEVISTIMTLLRVLKKRGPRLIGRMKLKVSNLDVTFAKEDPAETAIFYGQLMAVINGLSAMLSSFFKVGYQKVCLQPDFEAEESYSKIQVQFGLWAPLWAMLSFLLGGGIQFLKEAALTKEETDDKDRSTSFKK